MNQADVYELLILLSKEEAYDDVFWTYRGPLDAPWGEEPKELHCIVNCSDLWHWASADGEELFAEDFADLRQAFADMQVIEDANDETFATVYATTLWACRKRGMRPQRPVWQKWKPEIQAIFMTTGPERDPKDEG